MPKRFLIFDELTGYFVLPDNQLDTEPHWFASREDAEVARRAMLDANNNAESEAVKVMSEDEIPEEADNGS